MLGGLSAAGTLAADYLMTTGTIMGWIGAGAIEGAQFGAFGGLVYGAAVGAQGWDMAKYVALGTVVGAGVGAVVGAICGGISYTFNNSVAIETYERTATLDLDDLDVNMEIPDKKPSGPKDWKKDARYAIRYNNASKNTIYEKSEHFSRHRNYMYDAVNNYSEMTLHPMKQRKFNLKMRELTVNQHLKNFKLGIISEIDELFLSSIHP